ncbi:MAG TPA: hypothetical protein VEX65_01185, partial [Flavisolibacter sp.]|nr:hypothetical protein [Flavisolibacter sp.]
VGIFYYRLPGSNAGTLSGIVGKEFLSVVGDGPRSLAELLLRNSRAVLQWKALQTLYGQGLHRVPAKGESVTVVPYGNHSRGAKFVDLTQLADAVFTRTIDTLCKTIPQFYYGRLDVRFRSREELRLGTAFFIIELNGAGSEPTHIYDPKHSLFLPGKRLSATWTCFTKSYHRCSITGFLHKALHPKPGGAVLFRLEAGC